MLSPSRPPPPRPDAAAPADAVTRAVVARLHRNGPLQHGPNAVADAPRRLRPDVPDRPQRVDDVGARHVADGHPADVREREPGEARLPVLGVPRVAPAGPEVVPDPLGGLGEGGHAAGAALLGERIASGAGELAVGEGDLTGLLERDEREAAESEFPASAAGPSPRSTRPTCWRSSRRSGRSRRRRPGRSASVSGRCWNGRSPSTERDRVTGIAATTTPPERG